MADYVPAAVAAVVIGCLFVVARGLRHMRANPRPVVHTRPDWVPAGPVGFDDLSRIIRNEMIRRMRGGRVDWSRPIEDLRVDLRRVAEHMVDVADPLINRIERERLIDAVVAGIKPPTPAI